MLRTLVAKDVRDSLNWNASLPDILVSRAELPMSNDHHDPQKFSSLHQKVRNERGPQVMEFYLCHANAPTELLYDRCLS